jgi:hypothetical protein
MTIETERPTFRGVVCLHCKASIPVPAIVGSRQAWNDDRTESSQPNSQVFNIRCPECHKEKPYRTREIVDFDGASPTAMTSNDPVQVAWYSQNGMVRAAKA